MTKIKIIYFLVKLASKLYQEYKDDQLVKEAERTTLEKIDNETFEFLQAVNSRRKRVGLAELRKPDGFKRRPSKLPWE